MTARRMTPADLPRVLDLWQTCFGDPKETAAGLIDTFGPENLWVLGGVEAMTTALPAVWYAADGEEVPCAYLYAVATRPDRRGQGLCRSLLGQIEADLRAGGAAFACLHPAGPDLAGFYERLGYRPAFTAAERTVTAAASGVRCTQIDAARYAGLRELLLRTEFVSFPLRALRAAGQFWLLEDGGSLACAIRDGRFVPEFLGDADLAPGFAAALGVQALTLRTPGSAPFAWAKDLSGRGLPAGWLGPAFE